MAAYESIIIFICHCKITQLFAYPTLLIYALPVLLLDVYHAITCVACVRVSVRWLRVSFLYFFFVYAAIEILSMNKVDYYNFTTLHRPSV